MRLCLELQCAVLAGVFDIDIPITMMRRMAFFLLFDARYCAAAERVWPQDVHPQK
jgi:hypothetical protein